MQRSAGIFLLLFIPYVVLPVTTVSKTVAKCLCCGGRYSTDTNAHRMEIIHKKLLLHF